MSQLTSFRAGKLLSLAGALVALLVCTLLLTACTSGIDQNSTNASLTVAPVIAKNLDSGNGGQIDPTKSLPLAAGATSTPSRPTPVNVATTTAAAGATTAAAGATTAAAGGGASLTSAAGGAIELANKGDVAAGLRSFRLACQSCHSNGGKSAGPAGQPVLATSLKTGNADTIRGIVRNGNLTMPAIDKDTLPDADLENIIAYVQSIRTVK